MSRTFLIKRLPKASALASTVVLSLMLSMSFTGMFALTSEPTLANHSQCSDGIDNDDDGLVDYPQDDDCQNLDDDYEGIGLSGNFVTVTDGRESVTPGDAVVYVITLKQQRETARTVNVVLHLPHQANVVGASDGGSITGGSTVTWTNVSVYKNVTRTLSVNVNIDPNADVGQYLVARALVAGEEATDTTLIQQDGQISRDRFRVNITDGVDFVHPGDVVNYTVRVSNTSKVAMTTDVRVALPYVTEFLAASPGGVRDSYNVTWKKVAFLAGEEKSFTATVQVDRNAVNRTLIRGRAYAGIVNDVDDTVVTTGLPYDAITATITDGKDSVTTGQTVTYTIRVKNTSDQVATHVWVNANLPTYGEFVAASEGGTTDGSNIRWHVIQIAPGDTRTLTFTARIRPDAPLGTILTAGVSADGANGFHAIDKTTVGTRDSGSGVRPVSADTVLFRKTADRGEAVPGGKIRYTLFVRNTLDHVIGDATILDRYDSQYLSLQSFENGQFLETNEIGRMVWRVPVLAPGETWSTTYVLSVAKNAPTGLALENVATLRGSDLQDISLTERVSTNTSGVMGDFPRTGAGTDAILAGIMALLSLGFAGGQRKLAFLLA